MHTAVEAALHPSAPMHLTHDESSDDLDGVRRGIAVGEDGPEDVGGEDEAGGGLPHGVDDDEVDPQAQEGREVPEGAHDVQVLASGLREGGAQLREAERAEERVEATDGPHDARHAHGAHVDQDTHRRHEDARADDDADDDGHAAEEVDLFAKLHALLRHAHRGRAAERGRGGGARGGARGPGAPGSAIRSRGVGSNSLCHGRLTP